jgi:hypothetical protein
VFERVHIGVKMGIGLGKNGSLSKDRLKVENTWRWKDEGPTRPETDLSSCLGPS